MALVVLTREPPRNDELRSALCDVAQVVEVPLTETVTRPRDDVVADIAASAYAGSYEYVVVTSARSVDFVEVALAFATSDATVAVVGPKSAGALTARGGVVVAHPLVVGDGSGATTLAAAIDRGPVLALGADHIRPELRDALSLRGIDVVHVFCYSTNSRVLDAGSRDLVTRADVVVIAAPSAWENARGLISQSATVVAIGATTATAVSSTHPRVLTSSPGDLEATIRRAL